MHATTKTAAHMQTPRCRLSFPNTFQAKQIMGQGDPKFEVTCLFEKGADLTALQKAIIACATERWGDKALADLKAGKIHQPFRDQGEKEHLEGYVAGAKFFPARTKLKPFICDHRLAPITDPEQVYPGRYAIAAVNAFAWTHPMKGRGVSFGLIGLQLLEHAPRFGGGGYKPSDVFEPVEI